MPEVVAGILGWLVPAVVVFGVTAIAVSVLVWSIGRARRSPKARSAAEQAKAAAGITLVRLDDAIEELDLELGLSGALYGGDAPATLRRARLTAQRVRDTSFEEFRAMSGDAPSSGAANSGGMSAADVRRGAARIERRASEALAAMDRAREDHAGWVRANVSAAQQVEASSARLAALRETMGDPGALVADLSRRFAEGEWQEAARAARAAVAEAAEAERLLEVASENADDPSRSVLRELAGAERSLRQAEEDARILEESHRLVTQAAQALPDEFDAARKALRQAVSIRDHLEPDDADRLAAELRAIEADLAALEPDAARRPTRTVDAIARLRTRLDLALGDARTAQQRVRGARTALAGTLASARGAIAHAEAAAAHGRADADARSRLASAQRELAAARQAPDPVEALDAARRAIRDAEDAKALIDYRRLSGG